ncbi:macrolide ABC transporter ATPase [Sorangium cellulosum]|uniref:Macrolide ABC transporter ATPase n=1 Tax=Sorangium cellulosum TaxID=56 RepID=A0A2L0EL42_SORCE|nr:ABC transporter permease [Sorangium cellulosum]AUX40005.1 macrolide ABC transporter ATPase [Sorangium cellulosum]
MRWLVYLGIAAKALSAHKLRSLLTVLSITIGAFAIVLMTSLAEGGLLTLSRGIEDLGGARLILIAPKEPVRAERKKTMYTTGFTREDRDRLALGVPHVVEHALYAGLGTRDVTSDEGKEDRTHLVAADSRFFDVFRMSVARGRAFFDEEDRRRARVCIAGPKLAARLWRGDPIGRTVTVGALRCRVIGVLAQSDRLGVNFGFDWVDVLVAPIDTVADVDDAVDDASLIVIKTDDPRNNDPVKRILNALLVERHHGVDDFTLLDFSGIMQKFEAVFSMMKAIVGLIAGVALLIGGVGVMNMMLVSVSERVREIGIRKALGAAPFDISAQFLCEAALLSGFGGVLGVLGGALAAELASALIHRFVPSWVGAVSTAAVVAALLVSSGVGVVFGWLPARRAGRLDPVAAMRR